uniref:Kinesin-like protein n=1 Tax=Glossina morsitans morsitans TaxID=37546 RepID=A0A1B0G0T7_GLOMM
MVNSTTRTPVKVTKLVQQRELRTQPLPSSKQTEKASNFLAKTMEPVQVFCRLKPLPSDGDLCCVRVINSTKIILETPFQVLDNKQAAQKETQYVFKHIFESQASQQNIFSAVAQPMVESLIRGHNGLLFTYGVTGSGKTYTMTGDANHRGIMPRCLDTLFRAISDYQAKKFIFKSDHLNSFEIQLEADARSDRHNENNQYFKRELKRKYAGPLTPSQGSCDLTSLQGINKDNMYAVFITYVEVYNNNVYDLLEEGNIQKTLQSRIIREDANHNMFVHGVREIEIKSAEEAIEIFQTGQKRKRMGHTLLNAESSRSHSVFNIRLVQAPANCQGELVSPDTRTITIGQLSLVDLAGSERSSRTKNTGLRLREAGNINNSLMTLRTCLAYLRENQQQINAAPKMIPYRDSKITHLFKNYFDGEGQVSMIVCINPRAEDYDENAQVMKFAEMAQEVQIVRATPIKYNLGLASGRGKANKTCKTPVSNLNELDNAEDKNFDVNVCILGLSFPEYKIDTPAQAESSIQELTQYLLRRTERRKVLRNDLESKFDRLRLHLTQMEKENLSLNCKLASLHTRYKEELDRSCALESKVRVHENSIHFLNNKVKRREREIDDVKRQFKHQQTLLDKKDEEKGKQKKTLNVKLAVEMDKHNRLRECDNMRSKDENLSEESSSTGQSSAIESLRIASGTTAISTPRNTKYWTPRSIRGTDVVDRRHRRFLASNEGLCLHDGDDDDDNDDDDGGGGGGGGGDDKY